MKSGAGPDLVTTPGGLAEAGLGAVNPHDAHLHGLSHPLTPLQHCQASAAAVSVWRQVVHEGLLVATEEASQLQKLQSQMAV